jgi:mono/diheme cytochrome c family protein
MAATDQNYRNQLTLDAVFGVSCVLMLGSVIWMFVQDYNREFKTVQREFRDVEEALNEHMMLQKMPSTTEVEEKRKEVARARARLEKTKDRLRPVERSLMAQRDSQDNAYRSIKADFDSKMSYYNIAIEHYGKADDTHKFGLQGDLELRRKELNKLQKELTAAQDALDKTDQEIREKITNKLEQPENEVARTEDDLKKLTAPFDRFAKATAQRSWKFGDSFRKLPIIDAFESPTKIKQIWLPDLTIDYGGFKDVPRYDRCVSCHLAIDRPLYDKAELVSLGDETQSGLLYDNLLKAEKMLEKRKQSGENLGFDPSDLPGQPRGSAWKPAALLLLAFLIMAGVFGYIEHSVRVAMGITTVGAALTLVWGLFVTVVAPHDPAVKTVKLTKGQVTQYCAHPRLDLFVDPNSPHPTEKFGCTTCHAGQGSATDFLLASHTPADARQKEEWHKEYGWESNHFWDFPMLSGRFVESSCLKCHHQVTDLVRYGDKEEAPKLLKGYNLVRENGCFGCHEISGVKSGRAVGPDMRLEPSPALEFLTAGEQDKAKSDPLNPPGAYRKVGPSLRRLAEKTNLEWTRRWLQAPRGFRPDTKMPHFYNLSNNTNDPNAPETLPEDQKKFPDTEINAVAYYLIAESQASLKGEDTARKVLESRLNNLQGELKKGALVEKDRKDLIDVTRRLTDLALLSAPLKSREINAIATRLKNLQERLQDLWKKQSSPTLRGDEEALNEAEKKDLESGPKDLDTLGAELVKVGKPTPLSAQLIGAEGTPVTLPKAAANDKEKTARQHTGRELFTEKGCLACHSHSGTATPGLELSAASSQANFGPNLSRIAAKIRPEGGDADARRRWLVQWIMNPNIHHPRTNMPITHLTADQADAVAEWLLSQEVKDWSTPDPAAPSTDELVALARVYLGKAPGMTRKDVDDFLPATGTRPGISTERIELIREQSPDADEVRLEGEITDDERGRNRLLWYIGRKSVSRLGCFGCHDVPGFEQAKPIGTALNDWGKKDPERLAFEDGDIYVKKAYNIVETRNNPKDPSKPAADWKAEGGKRPFEKYFFDALEHHDRQGFLHLKLKDPRSYDYHRIRTWDDRLRMPQFHFSRTRHRDGESEEDYQARLLHESRGEYDAQAELDEAEAREAVMTFVLGLVAEPVPLKYLNNPNTDRLAEIKGRQVLEKFNCAGCHQVRPGVFEFKPGKETLQSLQETSQNAASTLRTDYHFAGHNAWVGQPQPAPDRWMAFGTHAKVADTEEPNRLSIRLADALRYTGADGVIRDLPAGLVITLPQDQIMSQSGPFGGTFTDLMIGYLRAKDSTRFKKDDPDDQNARSVLPPPLNREGERVQPNWLYGFLLNPSIIRPSDYMLLRMPKFNLSNEDARTVVDYFSAVPRLSNPGAGVTAQYVTVDQRDPEFWRQRTERYVKGLTKEQLEQRVKEMTPAWEQELKIKIADAESGLEGARQAVKDTKDDTQRKQKEKELADREAAIKDWKGRLEKKDFSKFREEFERDQVYATDAFRAIANKTLCLQCHSIGRMEIEGAKGPNLALTAERLRPEWVKQWVGNPKRLFTYEPVMPVNFPNNAGDIQSLKLPFVGTPLEVIEATRDVLMDLPRLADLPGTRFLVPTAAPAGGGK